jgi:hypothetical protein
MSYVCHVGSPIQDTGLLDHLCEFLNKQRHPACPFVDLIDHRLGQTEILGLLSNHVVNLTACQPIETEAGLVGRRGPGRLELRAECHQRQHSIVKAAGNELSKELQRRSICPVQVLNDE